LKSGSSAGTDGIEAHRLGGFAGPVLDWAVVAFGAELGDAFDVERFAIRISPALAEVSVSAVEVSVSRGGSDLRR